MPFQEKPQFSHHFSTHSSEVSLQQIESHSEVIAEQKEGEEEKNDSTNSSPEIPSNTDGNNHHEFTSEVQLNESVSSKTGEENVESEDEESDEENVEKDENLIPYSIALLHQVLAFLITITNPSKYFTMIHIVLIFSMSLASLRYGLSTINILLEMNGDILANFQPLIELLQGNFCKYLIQNSQSDDSVILSLSLRVIFNLFQGLKSFLKVQLEVFFTSVHIRLADMYIFLI